MVLKSEIDGVLAQACREWENGNLKAAFRLYKEAWEGGHWEALHNLAYFYDEGIGVRKNRREALRLYRASYRDGNSASACNIGVIYRDLGNRTLAKKWFMRGLELGDLDAALEVAKLYCDSPRAKERKKAAQYLQIVLNAKAGLDVTEDSVEQAEALLEDIK